MLRLALYRICTFNEGGTNNTCTLTESRTVQLLKLLLYKVPQRKQLQLRQRERRANLALHLPNRDAVVCNSGNQVFAAARRDDRIALLRLIELRGSDLVCVYLVLHGIVLENVEALPATPQCGQENALVVHVIDCGHHHLAILRHPSR